jgi:hypothetical protein
VDEFEVEEEADMIRGGEVMLNGKTKCVWCFDFDFDFQEISRVRARFLSLRVSPPMSTRLRR